MIRHNLALFNLVFFAASMHAQNINDAGMWNAFAFSADIKDLTPWKDPKIFKDWSVQINPEFRFNENASQLSNVFSDFGTDKKWSKYLTTSLEYRVGARREEDWFNLRKRWSLGIQLSYPFNNFKLTSTTRCQISRAITSEIDIKSIWRERISLEFSKWEKLAFQVSHELFFLPITLENSNWRSQAAIKYKMNKSNTVSVGYLVQRDLSNADMDFIFLTGYKWELNKKKEKSTPAVQ
jgi:hypothetical protein